MPFNFGYRRLTSKQAAIYVFSPGTPISSPSAMKPQKGKADREVRLNILQLVCIPNYIQLTHICPFILFFASFLFSSFNVLR